MIRIVQQKTGAHTDQCYIQKFYRKAWRMVRICDNIREAKQYLKDYGALPVDQDVQVREAVTTNWGIAGS